MQLLAVCEGTSPTDQVLGTGVALAVSAFWIGMVWLLVWSEREPTERGALFIILVLGGGVAAAVILSLHGALETNLLLALIATTAVGAGASHLLHVGIRRGVSTAIIGGLALPVFVLVVLLLHAMLGGGCGGEDIG